MCSPWQLCLVANGLSGLVSLGFSFETLGCALLTSLLGEGADWAVASLGSSRAGALSSWGWWGQDLDLQARQRPPLVWECTATLQGS